MIRMKAASEREDEYKRQVNGYLTHVQIVTGWSQSEIARQVGTTPSAISKALGGKHALGFDVLHALESASSVPIPSALKAAAAARRKRGDEALERIELFLERSPEWRRLVEIAAELATKPPPERTQELVRERDELMRKVA